MQFACCLACRVRCVSLAHEVPRQVGWNDVRCAGMQGQTLSQRQLALKQTLLSVKWAHLHALLPYQQGWTGPRDLTRMPLHLRQGGGLRNILSSQTLIQGLLPFDSFTDARAAAPADAQAPAAQPQQQTPAAQHAPASVVAAGSHDPARQQQHHDAAPQKSLSHQDTQAMLSFFGKSGGSQPAAPHPASTAPAQLAGSAAHPQPPPPAVPPPPAAQPALPLTDVVQLVPFLAECLHQSLRLRLPSPPHHPPQQQRHQRVPPTKQASRQTLRKLRHLSRTCCHS